MFRKPTKKIQRRVFNGIDEDDDGEPEPPPPPVISRQKKENKPAKSTPLLSFVDEEDNEGEVFKVKKSSQSKRLAKKREKEKKSAGGDSKYENNVTEDKSENETALPKAKKKVTLEGLILAGREALAADGAGDLSDEEPAGQDEEETGGFHRYRAETVRAALAAAAGDGIPDAALIHAARKTRQQARELGGDYISIRPDNDRSNETGSRLDMDDGSGDDDEERIHVRGLDLPSDKPKRGTAAAAAEMDSEAEEWEEQQMQKAVPAICDITGDMGSELNPFAAPPPPPPPRLDDVAPHLRPLLAPAAPSAPAAAAAPAPAPAPAAPQTAQELVDALRIRLRELQTGRAETAAALAACGARVARAQAVVTSRGAVARPLERAYRRAQGARAYLTDLVECLDEKMPALEQLEARALTLQRRRCQYLQERRRTDARDQAQDVLALAARAGVTRQPDPEDKVRRAAEREGRRRARRLRREAAPRPPGAAHYPPPATPRDPATAHRDGDSSDDELPPDELQYHVNQRESILSSSASLFSDALRAWRSVHGVTSQLSRWRRHAPALYRDAYVAECLPKLVAPYVRHQLILWNPLGDEDNEDYEKMDWYKCLMMYGVGPSRASSGSEDSSAEDEPRELVLSEESVRTDPDLYLVPTVINRVVLPKLCELVENAWDPMCVRACVRLRGLLVRFSAMPGAGAGAGAGGAGAGAAGGAAGGRGALRQVCAAAKIRLARCLSADVMLPALPPQLMEGPGGVFWRRCLGAALRLLRAVLALCAPPAALAADPLALALVGTVSAAAAAAPGPAAAHAASALACTLPRPPSALRAQGLRHVAALAQAAMDKLETDNPMHLKSLEQVRDVLAEARASQNT